jgi:hypothetical protein
MKVLAGLAAIGLAAFLSQGRRRGPLSGLGAIGPGRCAWFAGGKAFPFSQRGLVDATNESVRKDLDDGEDRAVYLCCGKMLFSSVDENCMVVGYGHTDGTFELFHDGLDEPDKKELLGIR